LKFPLTLPLSPMGEREGVRGQNVRKKFLDSRCKNLINKNWMKKQL
jgi:hypothetical protein